MVSGRGTVPVEGNTTINLLVSMYKYVLSETSPVGFYKAFSKVFSVSYPSPYSFLSHAFSSPTPFDPSCPIIPLSPIILPIFYPLPWNLSSFLLIYAFRSTCLEPFCHFSALKVVNNYSIKKNRESLLIQPGPTFMTAFFHLFTHHSLYSRL